MIISSIPVHKHGASLHLLNSFDFFHQFCSFSHISLIHSLLDLYLSICTVSLTITNCGHHAMYYILNDSMFLISNATSSLLVYRKAANFAY